MNECIGHIHDTVPYCMLFVYDIVLVNGIRELIISKLQMIEPNMLNDPYAAAHVLLLQQSVVNIDSCPVVFLWFYLLSFF